MTPTLTLARTREELVSALRSSRSGQVGLVPTMGALHDGHASLIRTARASVDVGPVVVSIFVNPLQFGPGEDLARYPRTFEQDLDRCAVEGVDVVFAPSVDEVYPGGEPQVTVDPGPLALLLEGVSRPTHFAGVLTVVAKLFGLVRPDVAIFGEKDYQQLALVRRMSQDLCLGVQVVGAPTVRAADGLALSSRNRYLDATARGRATVLSRALSAAVAEASRVSGEASRSSGEASRVSGEAARSSGDAALRAARSVLHDADGVDLDYLALTAPDLGPVPARGEARMLLAARVGGTRLIDNVALHLGHPGGDS